ncbi:dTDP-4-dehydrorhamnose reductase family protein [Paenibacillus pinistramenti]|uniref:dTDP-4-dehydrorhamnose reductase family protein n=1 Tax=Paenibacillus pinistramenti TaxID=1768003 RepID=UPI001107FEF0|nr:SDR family oxidoreductase [Paenibacillus pinistramenti]
MKLLILGGNGMAGHMLVQYFKTRQAREVLYTTRDARDKEGILADFHQPGTVEQLIGQVRPDVIINAVGILNQYAEQDAAGAYEINGFLPHKIRLAADAVQARLIHISTDCVFLGSRGGYTENDLPDGTSYYAVTKALGEIKQGPHLTIRTSIIGPEIRENGIGLLSWFLKQKSGVPGYTRVFWNGVTTLQLAKAIDGLLDKPLHGLMHLAHPERISKYELLQLFRDIWERNDIQIIPTDTPELDRTLVSTRPEAEVILPDFPDYTAMLRELHDWMKGYE